MSFSVDAFRGARRGTGNGDERRAGRTGRAVIDHRLERLHLVNEYRRGRLRREQICDAHPELIRAAKNVGSPSANDCPICEEQPLALVTYVFGPRLPSHGRCVSTKEDMEQLDARGDDLDAYVVEACTNCHWHHLLRVIPVGGRRATPR